MKRLAAFIVVLGAVIVWAQAVPALAGGNAGLGCSTPYEGVTFQASLQLPKIQAGLDAGAYTVDQLQGSFTVFDHNSDGVICLKVVNGWDNANPNSGKNDYFYLANDDNSSAQ